ncbi:MAG: TonB-dependent receptor [Flavobacteriales bacterium]|nr:TonB-dependent receptor [Flavobacteriales bacterium]
MSRPEGYNQNLKWERSTKYNAGFDYGLNKGKLTGNI